MAQFDVIDADHSRAQEFWLSGALDIIFPVRLLGWKLSNAESFQPRDAG